MTHFSDLVCLALIGEKNRLLKNKLPSFLPEKRSLAISSLDIPQVTLLSLQSPSLAILENSHFSWFIPFLRNVSEHDLFLFLSSLPFELQQHLQKALRCVCNVRPMSSSLAEFFQNKLISCCFPVTPLPKEALPPSPFNELLVLSCERFRNLIEFLGLYDLAAEMKQMIDGIKIKKIKRCLSQEKLLFLSLLFQKQEPVLFKKMELNAWNELPEDLLGIVYQRGINRIAKALFSENSNLIFLIKLRMSMEDAQQFERFHKPLEHLKAHSLLCDEVFSTFRFLEQLNSKRVL